MGEAGERLQVGELAVGRALRCCSDPHGQRVGAPQPEQRLILLGREIMAAGIEHARDA